MKTRTGSRYFTAWLLMLAMLWAMVAPSISQATAATRGDILIPMCTVSGVTPVTPVTLSGNPDDSGEPGKQSAPAAPDHCKLCSMHSDSGAPPPAAQPMLFGVGAGARYPFLFFQSSSQLAVWSPAQSRAPPVDI